MLEEMLEKTSFPDIPVTTHHFIICDMIKRNESDVGNVFFGFECSNSFILYCFEHSPILHNSVTRYPIIRQKKINCYVALKWEI